MSKRVKPDRRTIADRGSIIEIVQQVNYPGIPQDFVDRLKEIKRQIEYYVEKFPDERYREDWMREDLRFIMSIVQLDNLNWLMREYGMLPELDE
jgi:predicted RNA-binding protein with EMAP domain